MSDDVYKLMWSDDVYKQFFFFFIILLPISPKGCVSVSVSVSVSVVELAGGWFAANWATPSS